MSNTSQGVAPSVIAAEAHDADRVFGVLTLAFAADPPNRWMYPEPVEYLRYFPDLLGRWEALLCLCERLL